MGSETMHSIPRISILEFGAIGDGIADETIAFEKAQQFAHQK